METSEQNSGNSVNRQGPALARLHHHFGGVQNGYVCTFRKRLAAFANETVAQAANAYIEHSLVHALPSAAAIERICIKITAANERAGREAVAEINEQVGKQQVAEPAHRAEPSAPAEDRLSE